MNEESIIKDENRIQIWILMNELMKHYLIYGENPTIDGLIAVVIKSKKSLEEANE